jgi:hypothetical protein
MTESSNAFRLPVTRISESNDRSSAVERPREVIFINQYSTDPTQKKNGPGRRAIGSYVQRGIHSRKRLEANERLKSSIKNSAKHGSCSTGQQQKPSTLPDMDMMVGAHHGTLTRTTIPEDRERPKSSLQLILNIVIEND